MMNRFISGAACGLALLWGLAGCVTDNDNADTSNTTQPAAQFTIGGNVRGLASGKQLALRNSNDDTLTITADGAFTFPKTVAANGGFQVTVATQPEGQTCTVSGATGAGVTANVSNIAVTCSSVAFSVGGTVSGLPAGKQLTLANNGADPLVITADGAFTFATPVAYDGGYSVTVAAQPAGQTCSVAQYAGSGVRSSINSIRVTCATNVYKVGGTVSGLGVGQSITLQNNGGDVLTLPVNGAFTFATGVVPASPYNVTVLTQPAGQTCTVTNSTGTIGTADVGNIQVVCTTYSYTVGGAVSGLQGGARLTLQNNGADNMLLTANGAFTFATPIAYNASYNVTVATQPLGQICTVSNGTGSGVTFNVTNVSVSCVDRQMFIYVTDRAANQVLMFTIDPNGALVNLSQTSTPGMASPYAIAAMRQAGRVLIANFAGNSLTSFSTTPGGLLVQGVETITGGSPIDLVVDPLERFVFTANAASGTVGSFSVNHDGTLATPATIIPVGTQPTALAEDAAGKYLYVANRGGFSISQIAVDTGTVIGTFPMASAPDALAIDYQGKYLYAFSTASSSFEVFTIGANGILLNGRVTGLPAGATGMAASPIGPDLYILYRMRTGAIGSVLPIRLDANGNVQSIGTEVPTGDSAVAIAIEPAGRYAYVTNGGDGTISQYTIGADGSLALMPVPSIPVGALPSRMTFLME